MQNLLAGGAMSVALAQSYGAKAFGPAALNIFFADHISVLRSSQVELVSQTGAILDGAMSGYGIGYVSATSVIAAGHLMLGNTLEAALAASSAATFTNPAAATCAAIGAVFYGYHALSEEERDRLLDKLSSGVELGKRLLMSMISYVQNAITKVMNSDLLAQMRKYVSEYADRFGKSIADITKSVSDRVVLVAHQASAAAYEAASTVGNALYEGASSVGQFGQALGEGFATARISTGNWFGETSAAARDRVVSLFYEDDEKSDK